MSQQSDEFRQEILPAQFVKVENQSDDEDDRLTPTNYQTSQDPEPNQYSSTNPTSIQTVGSAYKGKIEVTSKGRRKIFDGVRWQILCRRPECRKQTNKKSLCITHYKEEYERHGGSSSSWPEKVSSFEIFSYRHGQSNGENHTEIDRSYRMETNNSPFHEGQIRFTHNGRRFILKNSKWQPLCKYDNICRSTAKYELLCIKHFQTTQERRRRDDHHRRSASTDDEHQPNEDFRYERSSPPPPPPPSVTNRCEKNSNGRRPATNENVESNSNSKRSKSAGFEFLISTSEKSTSENPSSNSGQTEQNERSVQTDLTIPVCCQIYRENHALYSFCIYDKSKSSNDSFPTKDKPRFAQKKFSS